MVRKDRLRGGRLLLNASVISVLVFLVLPAFIVIPMSLGPSRYLKFPPVGLSLVWYKEMIHSERWLGSIWLSFQVASLTTLIATAVGTLAALAMVRGNFPGKAFLNGMIILPMVVPVIIIAIAVYGLYAKLGLVGTRRGLVFAHSVLAFPYVFLIMRSNLLGFDTDLELAAMNLGANKIKTFFLITLPLILPGVMTSAIFAFIVSFDELVVANFISGIRATTLPKQMFDGIRLEVSPVVAVASSILILVSTFTILLLQFLRKEQPSTRGAS